MFDIHVIMHKEKRGKPLRVAKQIFILLFAVKRLMVAPYII